MIAGLVVTGPLCMAHRVAVVTPCLVADDVLRRRTKTGVRARLQAGEAGRDIHGMQGTLAAKGLAYRPSTEG